MTRHELEAIFARVLEWPEERQHDVLSILKTIEEQDAYELTPEEEAEIALALEEDDGEFVSDEEMEAFWKRLGV